MDVAQVQMPNDVKGAWLPGKLTTVAAEFEKALDRRGPDFAFLDFSGVTYILGELDRQSTQLAHGLRAAGASRLRPGIARRPPSNSSSDKPSRKLP